MNFQTYKLYLEKAEETEIKLPTSVGSSKKQESSRKTSSALLNVPKPLAVWIKTTWKILKEMEIPDHLTCLLQNLYAGQEATVRTRHGPQSCPTFETHGLQPTRLLCPWDFPGKSPGVGCHCYLVFAPEKGPCKFPKPYWL